MIEKLTTQAIELLNQLIETPSFSSEEEETAQLIEGWFIQHDIPFERENNNIWAYNEHFDDSKPTILLNSHHDTVKPNGNYTNNPFSAFVKDKKLYGLGSNDAGGCLVSLIATFTYFYKSLDLQYNLVIVASAEEESSGPLGLKSVLKHLKNVEFAIVGEPTLMQLAIAEKGLLVLDVSVKGTASHAAHPNDDNAIYNALNVIRWFETYAFNKISDTLGKVKMTVTQINAGKQHNVVPASCDLVVDVRVNDKYKNEEVLQIITQELPNNVVVKPRSLHLGSSSIPIDHPIVKSGIALGRTTYGSPTLSDQSVLSCPSLKMGPGDSTRSHSADEFIYLEEVIEGVELYIKTLDKILK
ncbi:M20/M25/M40 family metallo-hydrolase [Aquimarina sp. AD10]|uniref:M20 family metallo-hydrolase n=1 Tax=Aquimarina sp. AD10 TaxID=1714849 RepID=UPI000E4B847A|nr:M20 family metallo-hydrolase [Aquimarina sp. AD10]AXT58900.1 M20/M25/M40 family metallo-hydrolase [Aquimarina sp. AD10]RKM99624.1 M20/M25/M40 family metallo-hydrolase [Aquimarina sp. AD10]